MDPEALRRWLADRQAAERLEHAELRAQPRSREAAIRAGLDLIEVAKKLHGWPLPVDPAEEAEDERVWRDWDQLRAWYGKR